MKKRFLPAAVLAALLVGGVCFTSCDDDDNDNDNDDNDNVEDPLSFPKATVYNLSDSMT